MKCSWTQCSSPSFNKASIWTPAACDAGGHSTKELSSQLIYLSILRRYRAAPMCHTLKGKSHLCIPFLRIARPQSQFPQSCVPERFIYSQDRSTYFPAVNYADLSWEYINRSQTHECGNWDCGRAIPFHGIFDSNFMNCVFARQMFAFFFELACWGTVFIVRHDISYRVHQCEDMCRNIFDPHTSKAILPTARLTRRFLYCVTPGFSRTIVGRFLYRQLGDFFCTFTFPYFYYSEHF
jgi:hypothetical protein